MNENSTDKYSDLQNSEKWAELIYNVTSDYIFLIEVDKSGKFKCISVNSTYLKGTGLELSQIIGKSPDEILPPDAAQYAQQRYEEAIKAKHAITYEENAELNDKIIAVETTLTPIINNEGICTHLLGSCHDISFQKKSEKILKENEEKFRVLTENISDVVWVLDTETLRFLYVSPSVEKLRGYTPEEVIAQPVYEALTKEGIEFLQKAIKEGIEAFMSGELKPDKYFINEMEQPCKNGSTVWTEVITSFYLNEKTGHIEVRGVTRDISERKKVQDFTKSLLQTIPFGMDIVDENGKILFMSENFQLKFNEDVIGKTCWSLYRDDKTQCQDCPLRMNIEIGETSSTETDNVLNGRTFQITHTGMLYDGKKAVLEIFQDITEKKLVDKKIKFLAHSLESISECVSITDYDDTILYVNESFIRTYGYDEKELVGKNGSMLRPSDYASGQGIDVLQETKNGGWRGELINKKKDGSLFPIMLSTSVIKDDNQVPIALIGVASDITEMKKNQEELIAAKNKAEEMSRLKSSFLANMGHELRTPMIGIIGFAEILSQETQDHNIKDAAETVLISAKRLMDTLNLILELSRVEADKLEYSLIPIDIIQITNEVCKLFGKIIEEKSLYLNIDTKFRSLQINLDEKLFRQILTNLVNNAVKFTFKGGVLIEIYEESIDLNEWVVINVKDTGLGIAKENLRMIFDDFRQVSEGYGRIFEGTGLGLSLTKKFVEKMNGNISVESQLNIGSVFSIRFPVRNTKN